MLNENRLIRERKGLILLGVVAIAGHLLGVAADIYSAYVPGVDLQLGPITSLSLANIAPLFEAKPLAQAKIGHYLAIFFIPLGLCGIFQVFVGLRPSRNKSAAIFLILGTLGLIYATFYHGTLAFLIGALHQSSLEVGSETVGLVSYFNSLSEPLGRVLLVADVLVSSLYVLVIMFRSTYFPKLMAVFNPLIIQLVLSLLIMVVPHPLNQLIWLTVFNASLVIWYFGTTIVLSKYKSVSFQLNSNHS